MKKIHVRFTFFSVEQKEKKQKMQRNIQIAKRKFFLNNNFHSNLLDLSIVKEFFRFQVQWLLSILMLRVP